MEFIEQLLKEKEKHIKSLEAINILLESYGHKEAINTNITPRQIDNNGVESPKTKKGKRFPVGGTYLQQIEHILNSENRFLHSYEIAEVISEKEGISDLKWLKKRVSAVLSKAKANNQIKHLIKHNFGRSTKDAVWGYAYWLDENKNIKEDNYFKNR